MWNYLVSLSSWVEGNSGQIQILIAVIALGLAVKGYFKVLEQINISRKQEEEVYSQRNYELKLELISLLFQISDSMHTKLKGLYEIQYAVSDSIPDIKSEEDKQEANKLLNTLQRHIDETEGALDHLNKTLESANNKDDIDYKVFGSKLKLIYSALIASNKDTKNIEMVKTKYLVEED